MHLLIIIALFSFAGVLGLDVTEDPCPECRKCYNCGYLRYDSGEEEKLPELEFCGDFATPTDIKATCSPGDCCGVLTEHIITIDEDNGENKTFSIGRHGCSKDIDHMPEYHMTCEDDGGQCKQIEDAHLPDHGDNTTVFESEICLCDTDLCNTEDPIFDVNKTSTTPKGPTDPPPSKECYNCGYKCINMVGDTCTPVPIATDGGINFCKDTATMAAATKKCTGADECCGSIREYFEFTNSDTGKTTVDMIAYHGCEKDLAPALEAQISLVCSDHTNSCFNVSRDEIQDQEITRIKACFCEGDRCNNNIPALPNPNPNPNEAILFSASMLSFLLALLLLS